MDSYQAVQSGLLSGLIALVFYGFVAWLSIKSYKAAKKYGEECKATAVQKKERKDLKND